MFTKLLGLPYHVVYKQGSDNRIADALSRRAHQVQCSAISAPVPAWLEDIVASYVKDPKDQDLQAKLAISPTSEPPYSLHQGIIRYKGTIWVGADLPLQTKIIHVFHSSAVGGHSGFSVTDMRIKQVFFLGGFESCCSSVCC